MEYNKHMKTLLNKLMMPFAILILINMVGLLFYKNYEGAVMGSVIGMLVGFLILEIRAKFE